MQQSQTQQSQNQQRQNQQLQNQPTQTQYLGEIVRIKTKSKLNFAIKFDYNKINGHLVSISICLSTTGTTIRWKH